MDFSWGGSGDVTDSLLKDDGVNLDDGPDAELRRAVRPLDLVLRDAEGVKTADAVRQLWTRAAAVVAAIDTLTVPTPHERVLHASWGSVSNAVEKIVQSEHYHEDVSGHPSQAALLEVLNRMADSPYPAERGPSKSSLMSWGNWDIRVYVASSYMRLAASSSSRAQALRDSLTRMLGRSSPHSPLASSAVAQHAVGRGSRPHVAACCEGCGRRDGRWCSRILHRWTSNASCRCRARSV
jgi:hypothetical protein